MTDHTLAIIDQMDAIKKALLQIPTADIKAFYAFIKDNPETVRALMGIELEERGEM